MDNNLTDNLSLPVVAAPMFLISGPALVIACCKAGIVGTLPALNQRTTEGFEQWVIQIKTELAAWEEETGRKAAPFGVNLIVHPTNPRIQADLAICVKHQVPLIITSLGAVAELVQAVHSYGGKVFHDVINIRHAKKAIGAKVDGLILVCAGAGGHAGTFNPMPFIQEVKKIFNGTILLSGCISTGQDIASAMQMGADLAYMGTRFINVDESNATEEYKEMVVNSKVDDIVYTAAISGVGANFMRASLEASGITKDLWEKKVKVDFGKELDTEAKAWKTIWSAGQGASTIDDKIPLNELVERLKKDFSHAIKKQQLLLERYKV